MESLQVNESNELPSDMRYGSNPELDKLVDSEDFSDRYSAVLNHGYGLDVLVNDPNRWVRCAVAEQGYGLDILVNDKDSEVRSTAKYAMRVKLNRG